MDRERQREDKRHGELLRLPAYKAFRDEIEIISMELTKKYVTYFTLTWFTPT